MHPRALKLGVAFGRVAGRSVFAAVVPFEDVERVHVPLERVDDPLGDLSLFPQVGVARQLGGGEQQRFDPEDVYKRQVYT